MDLSRPVGYRSLALNDAEIDSSLRCIVGNELRRVEWSPVGAVGYKEKRAVADGFDASDVYLSGRVLTLSGTTYGATKGDLFDRLQALRLAFTPTSAYAEDPGARGYLPLDFYVPTDDPNWVGERHVVLNVRPANQFGLTYERDKVNADPATPHVQDWTVQVEAIDPRVYAYSAWEHTIPAATTPSLAATAWSNKGNYAAPLKILLVVAASAPSNSKFHFEGGGANFDLWLPTESYAQIVRYDSALKVVTIEINGVESLRMETLTFNARTTHPLVQPDPVAGTYQYAVTGATTLAGGRIWFNEAWA